MVRKVGPAADFVGKVLSAGENAQKQMVASTFREPWSPPIPSTRLWPTIARWVVKSLYVMDADILSAEGLACASRSAVASSAKSTLLAAALGGWKPLSGISRRIRI